MQMARHPTPRLSATGRLQRKRWAIANQLQKGNERTRETWEEAVLRFSSLPGWGEAQGHGTLATLSEQLAAGVRHRRRVGESLQTVRGALDALAPFDRDFDGNVLRAYRSPRHATRN